MKKPEKLYEGNMRKKFFLFALPLILSALLSQSYSFVNSMMIGKFIGIDAFAATAVTADLIQLLNSIFFGYLSGVGIYSSVLFGKNDYEKMLNVIKINFLFSSCLAIAISVLANVFCHQIFDVLNVSDELYRDAEQYFRMYVLGYLFFQFNWGFIYISNSMGMTKMPFISSIITGIFNICLNYLFLAIWDKGIGYSALASVISTGIATSLYLIVYARLFKNMGLKLSGIKLSMKDMKSSAGYGIPTMLQQMVMYLCATIVSPLANTCSTAALSGYAIANRAQTLVAAIYQNSSKANTNFIAQAMGAGLIGKIKQGIKIGVSQGLMLFGVTMGLFIIFAKEFTALFLDPVADAESFAVSVNLIRYLMPFIVFNVFNNLFHGIFRAVGSGKFLVISTVIYAVAFIAFAYLFFYVIPYDFRIYGIYLAYAGAYITEAIFATVIFVTGKWKTPQYRKIEQHQSHR